MLLLLVFSFNIKSQNNSLVDSLLLSIQSKAVDQNIAMKSLTIPYDKIVNNLDKCLFIYKNLHESNVFKNNDLKTAEIIDKLALVTYLKGNANESFILRKKSIELFDKVKDYRQKATAMASLAYESKRVDLKSSLRVMREAIVILESNKFFNDLTACYDNFGVLYEMNNELDTAMFYYNKALKLKQDIKDSVGIPYSLNNIAGIFFLKNNYNEGLKIIEQSNQIRLRMSDYIGICWNEFSLGEMYMSKKDFLNAEKHIRQSLSLAVKHAYPELIARNTNYLSAIMANKKQFDSAYVMFNRYFLLNDSLHNIQKQKQLIEMQTVYDTEKKAFLIESLNSENKLKETELEKKKSTVYFLAIIVLLMVVAGVFIVRAYRQKNTANKIISIQKIEAEKQNEIIKEKQKEIVDSINYAKRIQNALLAHDSFLDKIIPAHFVFFQPKDIVSGDFYWATEHNQFVYLAVCDSTGHGVPGAFMSLLNIGFLSEAIKERNISAPSKILDYVRARLVQSLTSDEQKDGMDAILVCFDKSTNKITYAAANNAPVLCKNNDIISLEYDKMPVGKGERDEPFRLFELNAGPGNILYLYTDGYADQFGGPKGKKFKYKQLNELLLNVSTQALAHQKQILQENHLKWKGDLEQVDDICIIGIKIA